MGTQSTRTRSGFTLVEVIVALAIVALLVGILVPALADVREHARRVICSSNQRQMGLGIHLYADQNRGLLPESRFLTGASEEDLPRPQDMVVVRVEDVPTGIERRARQSTPWDGLGMLYDGDYLPANAVYYCPSHAGDVRLEVFEDRWLGDPGEIVSNYHFRGEGPGGERRIAMMPSNVALVSDSLRSVQELNHAGGFNVLQSDLSVLWLLDSGGTIAERLAMTGGGSDSDKADTTSDLWDALDDGSTSPTGLDGRDSDTR